MYFTYSNIERNIMESEGLRTPLTLFFAIGICTLVSNAYSVMVSIFVTVAVIGCVLAWEILFNHEVIAAKILAGEEIISKMILYLGLSLLGYRIMMMANFPDAFIGITFLATSISCSAWYLYLVRQEKKKN